MKSNIRQKAFCEYYVECGNATESAIRAGYSERTARSIGQRLLTKVDVKAHISQLMGSLEGKRIASAEEVLKFLTSSMRGEIKEEVVVVEGDGDGYSSARVVEKQLGAKDRIKAAELLGKRHLLWADRIKLEGPVPVFILGEGELEE